MNTQFKSMRLTAVAMVGIVVLLGPTAHAQSPAGKLTGNSLTGGSEFRLENFRVRPKSQRPMLLRAGLSLMPESSAIMNAGTMRPLAAGPNLQVLGSGTVGRLTKWTGFTSGNSFISDSIIFESKDGLVGIGTDAPASRLTVNGLIQSLGGGFKFPDGTVQTTAAVTGLTSIFHDSTLTGNGTAGSPLGVAIPLILMGAVNDGNNANGAEGVLDVTNTSPVIGGGLIARGNSFGVVGFGGAGASAGVVGRGGDTESGTLGGTGVFGRGGAAANGNGGVGTQAFGGEGNGAGNKGGIGIEVEGGQGKNGAINGLAGKFTGDVLIDGDLNVTGTKNFKIDHPLDPENKYLYHAAVESSEVLNIYSGNVTTNEKGKATVALPDWFEQLNRDFRYQLTVVGTFAQAIIADEIKNNRFTIKSSAPRVKVSWQVTGIRSDRATRKTPFKVEEEKAASERGTYLSPEAYGQPGDRSVERARYPEIMRQLKQRLD